MVETARIAAARELFEETGIDIRNSLDRLQPVRVREQESETELYCELDKRIFFFVSLQKDDVTFLDKSGEIIGPKFQQHDTIISRPVVKISDEHSDYIFEPDPVESVRKISLHSGGVPSKALLMAMSRNSL